MLAAGAAAIYFISQGGIFADQLKVKIQSVKFNLSESQRTLFSRLYLNIVLSMSNPSRVQGSIESIDVAMIYKGKMIGRATSGSKFNVNAQSTTLIPLLVFVNTLQLVPSISDLLKLIGKGVEQSVSVVGTIKTNLGIINIDESVKFKI